MSSAIDSDSFRRLLMALPRTTWDWSVGNVEPLARQLGWRLHTTIPGTGAVADPGWGVPDADVEFLYRDDLVIDATIRLTRLVRPPDEPFLAQVYERTVAIATEVFGRPNEWLFDGGQHVRWRGTRDTFAIYRGKSSVKAVWLNNAYPDPFDGDYRRVSTATWAALQADLAELIGQLYDHDAVILRSGETYVQFIYCGQLDAEAVSPSPSAGAQLAALGWQAPEPPIRPNWWRDEKTPSLDAGAIAGRLLTTLRQVYGVTDSTAVTCQAFNTHTGGPIGYAD